MPRTLNPLRQSSHHINAWHEACLQKSSLEIDLLRHYVGEDLLNEIEAMRTSIETLNFASSYLLSSEYMLAGTMDRIPLNTRSHVEKSKGFSTAEIDTLRTNLQRELKDLSVQYARMIDVPLKPLSDIDSLRQVSTGLEQRLRSIHLPTRQQSSSNHILPTTDYTDDEIWSDIFTTLDSLSTPLECNARSAKTSHASKNQEPFIPTPQSRIQSLHQKASKLSSSYLKPLPRTPRLAQLQDPEDSMTITVNRNASQQSRSRIHS